MEKSINYTYKSKPIDTAVLSVLDVMSDGKIVSAADWIALWNTVLGRINHIDAYCSDINALTIDWQESVTAFEKAVADINIMFDILSEGFIHYGDEAPTDEHIRLWVQPSSEVDAKSLVNKTELAAAIVNSEATFANTIKGSASGSAIAMRDVSPIEHSVGCKVESKNLLDPNDYVDSHFAHIDTDGVVHLGMEGPEGQAAYIKYKMILESGDYAFSCNLADNGENCNIFLNDTNIASFGGSGGTHVINVKNTAELRVECYAASPVHSGSITLQLEKGTTATPYTPYIADLSTVKIKRFGKNLLNDQRKSYVTGNVYIGVNSISSFFWLAAGTYTFWVELAIDILPSVYVYNQNGDTLAVNYNAKKVTFTLTKSTYIRVKVFHDQITSVDDITCAQIELGEAATEYENYKQAKTLAAASDGTITGLEAVAPNMTLISNNGDAVINCNYNVDTKAYIDNKFAELQALILEG